MTAIRITKWACVSVAVLPLFIVLACMPSDNQREGICAYV